VARWQWTTHDDRTPSHSHTAAATAAAADIDFSAGP